MPRDTYIALAAPQVTDHGATMTLLFADKWGYELELHVSRDDLLRALEGR